MKQLNFSFGHRIARNKAFYSFLFLFICLTNVHAQTYRSNFGSITNNYGYSQPTGTLCLSPSIDNPGNIATADTTDFARVNGLLGVPLTCSGPVYSFRTKLNFPNGVSQAPAGFYAGFKVQFNTALNLSVLQNNLALRTYQADAPSPLETASGGNSIIGLNLLALGNNAVYIYFQATAPFSEVEFSFNSAILPVALAFDYRIYYGFASATTTLPLKLTAFDISPQAKDVSLSWTTTAETGTARFEVERSEDNNSFVKVGEVRASNNSREYTYSFTDRTAVEGTAYMYRLKMVDLDGSFTYSKIILADRAFAGTYKVYPSFLTRGQPITIVSGDISRAEAVLVDVSGKTVSKHTLNGKLTIPTDGLQKGLYLLKITGDKKNTVIKKIVVQ